VRVHNSTVNKTHAEFNVVFLTSNTPIYELTFNFVRDGEEAVYKFDDAELVHVYENYGFNFPLNDL